MFVEIEVGSSAAETCRLSADLEVVDTSQEVGKRFWFETAVSGTHASLVVEASSFSLSGTVYQKPELEIRSF